MDRIVYLESNDLSVKSQKLLELFLSTSQNYIVEPEIQNNRTAICIAASDKVEELFDILDKNNVPFLVVIGESSHDFLKKYKQLKKYDGPYFIEYVAEDFLVFSHCNSLYSKTAQDCEAKSICACCLRENTMMHKVNTWNELEWLSTFIGGLIDAEPSLCEERSENN